MKRKDEYIDNVEFEREIQTYRELGRPESCKLGQILTNLHLAILSSITFKDYPEEVKQSMLEYSLYRILRTRFATWNRSLGHRAFSYYSRAVVNNYMVYLKTKARHDAKEKKEREEWSQLKEEFGLLLV